MRRLYKLFNKLHAKQVGINNQLNLISRKLSSVASSKILYYFYENCLINDHEISIDQLSVEVSISHDSHLQFIFKHNHNIENAFMVISYSDRYFRPGGDKLKSNCKLFVRDHMVLIENYDFLLKYIKTLLGDIDA